MPKITRKLAMIFGLAITIGIIGYLLYVMPLPPPPPPESANPEDFSTDSIGSTNPEDFPDTNSLSIDNNQKVIENLKKATPEEIQNTFGLVESLDSPYDIEYVLESLDPGNLTKVLTNLPQGENETISKFLTEACPITNSTSNEAKSINQLLLDCKN